MDSQFTIVIADDHPLFRGALYQAVHMAINDAQLLEADSIDSLTHLHNRRAFDLALRLREGQFLQRAGEWSEAWTGKGGYKGRATRPLFLTACAHIVPCIVGTVYKVAQHNCYYGGDRDGTQPLLQPIDLLIYDEAGQVAPDLGLGLLGLARRAIAVGDVHQLQPLENFSEASDEQLMEAQSLTDAQQIACRRQGLNHAGGSVMAAMQMRRPKQYAPACQTMKWSGSRVVAL